MTHPSLTAAASRFTNRPPDQSWQEQAWTMYSTTPEVRFAAQWVANAMSGARIFVGRRAVDGTVEAAPDGYRAAELVASIAGGPTGQSQTLGDMGPHLVVAGEGWIVICPDQVKTDWRVLSVLELKSRGSYLEAEIDGDFLKIPAHDPDAPADTMAPIAIRVWEPHPRRHLEADSPVRSSLGLLEELHLLNASVKAIARSRLTGRGVFAVPHGTRFPRTERRRRRPDRRVHDRRRNRAQRP